MASQTRVWAGVRVTGERHGGTEHNRDFCVSFYFRKVNKCYRGRSCPIIVHCRQVQLLPWLQKRSAPAERPASPEVEPARWRNRASSLAAPKATDTHGGLCAVWLNGAVRSRHRAGAGCSPGPALPLAFRTPSLCCSPEPDPRHAGRGVEPCAGGEGCPGRLQPGQPAIHGQHPLHSLTQVWACGRVQGARPGQGAQPGRAAGCTGFTAPALVQTHPLSALQKVPFLLG